jgi:hypothetical protein
MKRRQEFENELRTALENFSSDGNTLMTVTINQ